MPPSHRYDLGVPALVRDQDQDPVSSQTWFGTYCDANLEKVSVVTFSSVTLASISLNARSMSGGIWNYMQRRRSFTRRCTARNDFELDVPFLPACRWSLANRVLVSRTSGFPVSVVIGDPGPKT